MASPLVLPPEPAVLAVESPVDPSVSSVPAVPLDAVPLDAVPPVASVVLPSELELAPSLSPGSQRPPCAQHSAADPAHVPSGHSKSSHRPGHGGHSPPNPQHSPPGSPMPPNRLATHVPSGHGVPPNRHPPSNSGPSNSNNEHVHPPNPRAVTTSKIDWAHREAFDEDACMAR